MAHGLVLLDDGLMALAVFVLYLGLATVVEQELGKVEVFLLASGQIEASHGHLGNLVAGHHAHLSGVRAHLLAGHVGIAAGNVEELALAGGLPVGHGTLNHVSQVVKLVR